MRCFAQGVSQPSIAAADNSDDESQQTHQEW